MFCIPLLVRRAWESVSYFPSWSCAASTFAGPKIKNQGFASERLHLGPSALEIGLLKCWIAARLVPSTENGTADTNRGVWSWHSKCSVPSLISLWLSIVLPGVGQAFSQLY